ncbi:MAG: ABC transporter permease [Euzebyales bacterium]|nr:ABC transporter permease [Euzebyales bacterium]MBA3622166.1 ABC transporter permease [Euzebyales bacterium]
MPVDVSPAGLAASLTLVALAVALSLRQRLTLARSILWATTRAIVQLLAVGAALALVIAPDAPLLYACRGDNWRAVGQQIANTAPVGSLMSQPQPTFTEVVQFHVRRAGFATAHPPQRLVDRLLLEACTARQQLGHKLTAQHRLHVRPIPDTAQHAGAPSTSATWFALWKAGPTKRQGCEPCPPRA